MEYIWKVKNMGLGLELNPKCEYHENFQKAEEEDFKKCKKCKYKFLKKPAYPCNTLFSFGTFSNVHRHFEAVGLDTSTWDFVDEATFEDKELNLKRIKKLLSEFKKGLRTIQKNKKKLLKLAHEDPLFSDYKIPGMAYEHTAGTLRTLILQFETALRTKSTIMCR